MNYKCLESIDCQQGAIRRVRFNVDGLYCLTAGSDKTIKLWNPHSKLFLKSYSGHGNEVLDNASSCDSSQIISGGADKCVIVWDVMTGKPLRRLRVHVSNVNCVKFNEEGSLGISGSHDNTVMIWDLRSYNFQPIQILRDAKDSITSLTVSDHEIITGSLDCRVRCYDIRKGCYQEDYIGEPVISVSLTNDGQCYVISTSNNIVWLFDKNTGELLNEYHGHETGDYAIESCVDGTDGFVLSGSKGGSVFCWDLVGAKVIEKLGHKGFSQSPVHSIHPHPRDKFLVTATQSHIHLWGTQPMDLTQDPPPSD